MTRTLTPKIPLPDLAQRWGWKAEKLYRLCAAGKIPHLTISGRIYFEEAALDRWLNEQRKETAGEAQAVSREQECARLGIEAGHEFA